MEESERQELLTSTLLGMLDTLLDEAGSMGVPVMDSIQEELSALEVTLESLSTLEDASVKTKVAALLKTHINSKALNRLANVSEESA